MQPARSVLIFSLFVSALPGASGAFAQQPGPGPQPATRVMAILSVREGITRDQIMKVMQTEIRDTVKLYLDGRIEQWYSRADGKGVVFVLECKTIDQAKALMDALPLSKEKQVTFDYIPLAPLGPLRLLLAAPPAAAQQ